jgi:hypothetical protein
MDELFEQEELRFTPLQGQFDVSKVAAAIEGIGYSFRDKHDPATFVICPDEQSRDHFQKQRLQYPDGGFPYVLLIRAEPSEIDVILFAAADLQEYAHAFVDWLSKHFKCRVTNESGTDLTHLLRG